MSQDSANQLGSGLLLRRDGWQALRGETFPIFSTEQNYSWYLTVPVCTSTCQLLIVFRCNQHELSKNLSNSCFFVCFSFFFIFARFGQPPAWPRSVQPWTGSLLAPDCNRDFPVSKQHVGQIDMQKCAQKGSQPRQLGPRSHVVALYRIASASERTRLFNFSKTC